MEKIGKMRAEVTFICFFIYILADVSKAFREIRAGEAELAPMWWIYAMSFVLVLMFMMSIIDISSIVMKNNRSHT